MSIAPGIFDYVHLLLQRGRDIPERPWLYQPIDGTERVYTWGECASQVQRMASALRARGWPPGSRIAISGRNTAHWFLADLAITMAGYVSVGLYPKQSAKVTKYIFEHAEVRAVFVGPALDVDELIAAVPAGIPRWSLPYPGVPQLDDGWDAMLEGHTPYTDYRLPPPEQMVMLVYTSGTSGFPKAVMLSAGNVQFTAQRLLQHILIPHGFMQPEGSDRLLSYMPLAHFFERLVGEGASLITGAQVHFLENLEVFAATLARVAPSMFCGVPLVYSRIQSGVLKKMPHLDTLLRIPVINRIVRRSLRKAIGLQNAKFILSGSAPIASSLVEWYERLGIRVLNGCAPTEAFAYIACNLNSANRIGSTGKVLPDAEVKLGEDGEILVRHPGVMLGYLKDEEATRKAFTEDGFLRTGDKGRFDEDGYLHVIGRTKEIFKTMKGKYVAPAPIEEAARTPDVETCCLVGPGVPQPILLVSLAPDALKKPRETVQRDLASAMERANASLDSNEQIGKIVIVAQPWTIDSGLLTPTMKIKREPIQQHYAELIARESANRKAIVWE